MNFTDIALQFSKACKGVKQAIKSSPYKASWFQQQLGFEKSPDAYYRRLNEGNWTPDHLAKIGQLLAGQAVSD